MNESNYAFPSPDHYDTGGLLKTEYFAAKALQGILAHPDSTNLSPQEAAKMAVTHAVELTKELRSLKKQNP